MEEAQQDSQSALEEKCASYGITPLELYMRQNNLCWLVIAGTDSNTLYCTDGDELHETSCLANPTIECSRCLAGFVLAQKKGLNGSL